jgi:hypothetical protein
MSLPVNRSIAWIEFRAVIDIAVERARETS